MSRLHSQQYEPGFRKTRTEVRKCFSIIVKQFIEIVDLHHAVNDTQKPDQVQYQLTDAKNQTNRILVNT